MVLGGVWYIVLAVVSRLVVPASIDTEDGEVTRVARPHPVVRITTELPYRSRRSEDQTYVAEDIVGDEVVLVIGVVGTDDGELVLTLQTSGLCLLHAFADLTDLAEAVDLILGLLHLSEDLLRDITDSGEVADGQPWDGELLLEALRDEAITEVVMIDRTL